MGEDMVLAKTETIWLVALKAFCSGVSKTSWAPKVALPWYSTMSWKKPSSEAPLV